MKYLISHSTYYQYSQVVGLCQNEARLQPRNFWRQQCQSSRFDITPEPSDFSERLDFFGNRVAYFAIQQSHQHLTVTATSEVELFPGKKIINQANAITWEQASARLQENFGQAQSQQQQQQQQQLSFSDDLFNAKQFLLDSPMIPTDAELADYARASFTPGRPLVETVADLTQRIHNDFTYAPSSTTIATPLSDVLRYRRGVCQDFAHLAIGCLRAFGIAARYISGYIETQPLPGKQRLTGADASHAWFAVYVPGTGWLEFDPTNNSMPFDQHITLAWGRDYTDVAPLKGIAFGGGHNTLSVSVDVCRLD